MARGPAAGRGPSAALAALVVTLIGCFSGEGVSPGAGRNVPGPRPLRVVVMDPLSRRLACDCVKGYAQRDYDELARFLEGRLGRRVIVSYAEALSSPTARAKAGVDLVIGKFAEVAFDAAGSGLNIRTVAMLTGQDGEMTQKGLFVVRRSDGAKAMEDLGKGKRRFLFGPREAHEKRGAALAAMEARGLSLPGRIETSPSCNAAAMAVVENEADVAVISSYAKPLLEGCGTVDRGALRVLGRTDPVPFICVFATDRLRPEAEKGLLRALGEAGGMPELLAAMESKDGFVALAPITGEWTDWRGGPGRDAVSPFVPGSLPARRRLLWKRTCTGPGMSGLAVASGRVIVADKDADEKNDIFRCLDADTGRQLWKVAYPAAGEMEFTNSPRANPVIHRGHVFLLGAFGDLCCVELESGRVIWKRNVVKDFGAERPTWGTCPTPLIVDDKLIVNPGAGDASLAALDRLTGEVRWKAPGEPPAYASFIQGTFGGVRQIVGYDAVSLGGWDPETGRRLWRLVPEVEGDFNVPTPVNVGGRLLVATENNGARLYGFDERGRIKPKPLAASGEFCPDTSTPVALGGLLFGNYGRLLCLDIEGGLKTLWDAGGDDLADYCSFIAGNGRVLVTNLTGKIFLVRADPKGYSCVSSLDLFEGESKVDREVWSHPALVGKRFYIRSLLAVYCFLLE